MPEGATVIQSAYVTTFLLYII